MTEVIIVGGGPVGLMLAHELTVGGVRPLVLERRDDIDPTIKAGYLNQPAYEALGRRGLLRPATGPSEETSPNPRTMPVGKDGRPIFVGHVAGMPIRPDLVDLEVLDQGPFATGGGLIGQQELERLLGERLAELGVEVRRTVTITGVRQDGESVRVLTADGVLEADWVIGCDGGRSIVRKSAGMGFPGLDGEMTGRQVVVRGTGLDRIEPGWHHTPTGVYRRMPGAEVILTAEFDGAPQDRDQPITVEEVEQSIRRVTGVPVTITQLLSATRFTDNTRVADPYRIGRVFVAGDAAHVHPPFGGQGLSLGMLDASDLGWRLAAVARGRADESILDGYQAERRPEAERILEWSRAQVGIMRTDERSRAASRLVRRLMETPDGATEAARVVSGQVIGYTTDDGPVGSYAPNWPGTIGTLWQATADGRAVLAHRPDVRLPDDLAADLADPRGRYRVTVFETEFAPVPLTLIRPDGVVSWIGTQPEGLADALAAIGAVEPSVDAVAEPV
ncbi:FAD-dependent monooxygenase [Microlunatus sp. Gsoil 973]|uniref:FAD-dependent monooxygenase n=1 Tax=Microlunatus sp. Gsoil 973 TaxID=2672569 RepID=UPI0012B4C3CC|nr:FAD-dependent monooxygenase [Microlunatus sp. Gsoil 973]QGN33383.1 FAD-dependent oxidoreductase [Microlunatus sp. Gsoil 973]